MTDKQTHQLCTAPMMDWSDRHCRFFFRQLAPHAIVYSEMLTTGSLIHGDVERHLDFNQAEHPVALQLGGSERSDLAHCAKLGESWGYDEINLNCGCPSERVQRGAFGACLMAEPKLVADCVKAMQDAVSIPITIKHRLGIDTIEDYEFVRRFLEILAAAGCPTFIVHARNAILKGLSPKDNRQVPALKYDYVYRLKRDFPERRIVINGGITSTAEVNEHLQHVDGVMLGRRAYHDPFLLTQIEASLGSTRKTASRADVVTAMWAYADAQVRRGTRLRAISRHMLGLYHGQPNARAWRRLLCDPARLAENRADLLLEAQRIVDNEALAIGA